MENLICSFFGHRDVNITEALSKAVTDAIGEAIAEGCRVFYFGGMGDFDRLCYEIVSARMRQDPALSLRRIFCVPQERYLRKPARYFRPQDYEDIGNMIDRIRLGYVVDFLTTEFMDFPIFNIADCFVTVGAVLLGIYILFLDAKVEKRLLAEKNASATPEVSPESVESVEETESEEAKDATENG